LLKSEPLLPLVTLSGPILLLLQLIQSWDSVNLSNQTLTQINKT
jgi:hypothetical protein